MRLRFLEPKLQQKLEDKRSFHQPLHVERQVLRAATQAALDADLGSWKERVQLDAQLRWLARSAADPVTGTLTLAGLDGMAKQAKEAAAAGKGFAWVQGAVAVLAEKLVQQLNAGGVQEGDVPMEDRRLRTSEVARLVDEAVAKGEIDRSAGAQLRGILRTCDEGTDNLSLRKVRDDAARMDEYFLFFSTSEARAAAALYLFLEAKKADGELSRAVIDVKPGAQQMLGAYLKTKAG